MSSKRKHQRPASAPEAARAGPSPNAGVVEDRAWSRLRQIFGSMSHRGTKIFPNHTLSPVVVDASSPEEATQKTDEALVDAVRGKPEN